MAKRTRRLLAFIRCLHAVGDQQSRQPEPLAAVSLLPFHDSQVIGVTVHDPQFLQYWQALGPKLPGGQLLYRTAMAWLNAARVTLKQHGTLVPERYRYAPPWRESPDVYRTFAPGVNLAL